MNADIIAIIMQSAAMGAAEALRKLQPADDRISKSQAEREFGRGFLKANADRLTVTLNGNRREYSRAELEQVKASRSVAFYAAKIDAQLFNPKNQ